MKQIKKISHLEISNIITCPKCGGNNYKKYGRVKRTRQQQYRCKNCERIFVDNPNYIETRNILPPGTTPQKMFDEDIWDIRVLGLDPCVSGGQYTLNFKTIAPDWLKYASKKWFQYRSSSKTAGTLTNNIGELRVFSNFIVERYPELKAIQLNRDIVVEYLVYLSERGFSTSHKKSCIVTLRYFLEDCTRFNYIDLLKEPLIFKEDIPKQTERKPRFIPNIVVQQLEEHINVLPRQVVIQINSLRETGMRVSELCNLKFDCITQDSTGDYWLKYYQIKMKKEHIINISKELATQIFEQQEFIRNNLGNDFEYLFCETEKASSIQAFLIDDEEKRWHWRRKIKLNYFVVRFQKMHANTLRGYLKGLAEEKNIVDDLGKIFPLSNCHRFRHTHGTDLINNGVPQHIVQKRLGHVSSEMTAVYAHIYDKTMKKEMEKFWDGRVLNNQGEVVVLTNLELDTAEMQWIKKNMKAQTLPDGFCGLPVTKTCPVQGSPCLTCSHLRTTIEFLDIHKKRLEETKNLIENARVNGWDRQVETNLPIAENLKKIIRGLEQKEVVYGDESFPEQEVGEQSA